MLSVTFISVYLFNIIISYVLFSYENIVPCCIYAMLILSNKIKTYVQLRMQKLVLYLYPVSGRYSFIGCLTCLVELLELSSRQIRQAVKKYPLNKAGLTMVAI